MESFLIVIILIMLGVFAYKYFFNQKNILKRKLKKMELKRLSSVQNQQLCKFKGKIQYLEGPTYSPLSERHCAFFRVEVKERRSNGKSSSWHTIIEEQYGDYFLVTDGEAMALIDGNKIKCVIDFDRNYSSGTFNDATTDLENFLRSRGHSSENFLGLNKALRYKEGVLEEGEEVVVLGQGQWQDASEYQIHNAPEKILVMNSSLESPVYISDMWELKQL